MAAVESILRIYFPWIGMQWITHFFYSVLKTQIAWQPTSTTNNTFSSTVYIKHMLATNFHLSFHIFKKYSKFNSCKTHTRAISFRTITSSILAVNSSGFGSSPFNTLIRPSSDGVSSFFSKSNKWSRQRRSY